MKHLFATILLVFSACSIQAQTEVQRYSPGITTDGVVYYLPQTQLKIAITATRTTVHPGDFSIYAQRFLRINDAVMSERTNWQVDKIEIAAYGMPDTSKVYLVTLKKGTSAPLCSLTDDGVLLSINASADKPQPIKLGETNVSSTQKVNSRDFLNQEILSAGSEMKMAELTATEIYNIRESRGELTKGEADYMPKDGEQLKIMLNKLDEQERALTQLFRGYSESETKTWILDYTPAIDKTRDVLARFSDVNGVVGKDDLSGEPIYINVANKKTVPYGRSELTDKKLINKVVYYNVASQADIDITFLGQQLLKTQMPIAQFGHEEYLMDDLFNKRATCRVWLNPITGNITKIEDDSLKK